MNGCGVGGVSGNQPGLQTAPNWGTASATVLPANSQQGPNGPSGPGQGYSNQGDQIAVTYGAPSNLISSSNQALLPSETEAPSQLVRQTGGARSDTTHKILMVTLLVNAVILLGFLATLALELSPRLSRHPGRRFGTPEWKTENLSLWNTMRVSQAAKAQADARDGGIGETEWNARGGRDLSSWLEPAPGEKLETTPLYQWLRSLVNAKALNRDHFQHLKQRFPQRDSEAFDRAVSEAPSAVKQMLGTFALQKAFLLALHEAVPPTVEHVAGELGGVSKSRLVGHVNTCKTRFFDRIL
jgi:hypothetical protein